MKIASVAGKIAPVYSVGTSKPNKKGPVISENCPASTQISPVPNTIT